MAPAANPACLPAGSCISAVSDLHTDGVGTASLGIPPLLTPPGSSCSHSSTTPRGAACPWATLSGALKP